MTIEVFKTWSLKINPSVWFLRVVPLTNFRSNIHIELFLFTLIPAYLAFGISGPVLKRIERLLSFGPQSPENIGIKSTLAKLRRRNSTPGPPTSDLGYNNTAAVRNSPGYWGGGGGCSPMEALYVCASQRVWCLRRFGLKSVIDFSDKFVAHCGLKSGMVFKGWTKTISRICSANPTEPPIVWLTLLWHNDGNDYDDDDVTWRLKNIHIFIQILELQLLKQARQKNTSQ